MRSVQKFIFKSTPIIIPLKRVCILLISENTLFVQQIPCFSLCKDGATFDVLDEVLARLEENNRKELISITRFFSGQVFSAQADRERLDRRFTLTLREFFEDSWTSQETLQEGLEKGRLEEARKSIQLFVEKRFPALLLWVTDQIEEITNIQALQEIMEMLFAADTAEEARQSFLIFQ